MFSWILLEKIVLCSESPWNRFMKYKCCEMKSGRNAEGQRAPPPLEMEIQIHTAQGRSTKTNSMIEWTRTKRLSIKNSLFSFRNITGLVAFLEASVGTYKTVKARLWAHMRQSRPDCSLNVPGKGPSSQFGTRNAWGVPQVADNRKMQGVDFCSSKFVWHNVFINQF